MGKKPGFGSGKTTSRIRSTTLPSALKKEHSALKFKKLLLLWVILTLLDQDPDGIRIRNTDGGGSLAVF